MMLVLTFLLVTIPLITLAIKWELRRIIAFPWAVLMGLSASLTIALIKKAGFELNVLQQLAIAGLQASTITLFAILILFFRDPERIPPAQEGIIVSPADGVIRYIKEIQNQEFPFALKKRKTIPLREFVGFNIFSAGGIQIGIGMSLLDVHVNRSPIAGKISRLKDIPGRFGSLKKISSLLENERIGLMVEGHAVEVAMVLIASRLVRRIRIFATQGQSVMTGQRIGMIRFGSQVDLIIPKEKILTINVKQGDKVKAGLSVLATF